LDKHLPPGVAIELIAQQVTAGWRVPECGGFGNSARVQGHDKGDSRMYG